MFLCFDKGITILWQDHKFLGVIQKYLGHVENLGMQHLIMDSIEPFLFMHCMQAVTNLPISL